MPVMEKKIQLQTRAILFDMDGVITNTMPDHFEAWRRALASDGFQITREDVYKREGGKGACGLKEIYQDYGRPYDEKRAAELLAQKEIIFKQIVQLRFIDGAFEFLRAMHERGFKLGLVTGTSRDELLKLLPADILSLFDVTVTGSEVQYGKPHPQPFQLALEKLNLGAAEAVVIENAPYGIRSAKSCGLRCLALTTSLPEKYLKDADGIFQSFVDLGEQVDFMLTAGEGRP